MKFSKCLDLSNPTITILGCGAGVVVTPDLKIEDLLYKMIYCNLDEINCSINLLIEQYA